MLGRLQRRWGELHERHPPPLQTTKSMHIYMQGTNTHHVIAHVEYPTSPCFNSFLYFTVPKQKAKETVLPARLSLGTTIIQTQAVAGKKNSTFFRGFNFISQNLIRSKGKIDCGVHFNAVFPVSYTH